LYLGICDFLASSNPNQNCQNKNWGSYCTDTRVSGSFSDFFFECKKTSLQILWEDLLKQVRKNDIFSLVIIIKSLFASQKSVTKKEKKKSTKGIIPIHTIMDMNYGVRTYLANTVFIYRFIYLQQIIQFSLLRPFLTVAENKKQFNFFRLFLALQLSFLKNNRELFSAKTVSAENK
jgi:hypothetical protein